MKRRLRLLLCLTLLTAAFTVSALADSGPKPQLTVRVTNAPEETYYLDLLEEGDYDGPDYGDHKSPYPGLSWSYSEEELAALEEDLLESLYAAIPAGWHACTAQGTNGAPMWGDLYPEHTDNAGSPFHTFGYHGVPETYRILLVTKGGESWVSDALTRRTLQSSVTVDWAAKTVQTPPVWLAYALEFLATLLPTLVIEGGVLWAFGYRFKTSWKPFLLVNLLTQIGFYLCIGLPIVQRGFSFWYLFYFVPAEVGILLVELFAYRRFLPGQGKGRATAYAVAANLLSATAGWFLANPIWQWITSLS